jgi:YidC/Oxa1 family membrane protein insertase
MEQKKFDLNSLIGFVLLGIIAAIYIYLNQPTEEQIAKKKAQEVRAQDSIKNLEKTADYTKKVVEKAPIAINPMDSTAIENAKSTLGSFAYSATLPSARDNETIVKNEVLEIRVSNLGGQITSIRLIDFKTYDAKELYLVKDKNASLNITLNTSDNRILQTKDLYFEPTLTQNGENQVLSMKLKVSNDRYLEYQYVIKPNEYMLDFSINSQGIANVINTSQNINLEWKLKTFRTEKSVKYENQYTELNYMYDNEDEFDYISAMTKDKTTEASKVNWFAIKKQFFSIAVASNEPFEKVKFNSKNLVDDNEIDTVFTKQFAVNITLPKQNNELNYKMQMYYGPTDYKILEKYENHDYERLTLQGWAIIRVINKYFIMPLFSFLDSFIGSLGLVIILLTIVVKLLMSPLLYKSFLSSAKMKVIKPEIQEINDKYKGKENAMKRQQESMALQRKAGVNPMAGCLPALLQMPIFFALFRFFPTEISLRQKSFLWATDLSAYDEIVKLPFNIPIYGSHIALFPILASITMFFYMKITQGQNASMQQPAQEGMPDMQKMMKWMMYFSPFMMLFFFNSYGSGLSIYYFISQLISILIMLVIKHYIIDEAKIHAKIQVNKQKAPKKKSAFRQRLDNAMKQAQEQQELKKKGKK